MAYTLKYNHPHFPEGTEFSVGNLGRVPNGGSIEVDEDMERAFLYERGFPLGDAFKGDHAVELTGSTALDQSEVDRVMSLFASETPKEEEDDSTPAWLRQNSEEGEENA